MGICSASGGLTASRILNGYIPPVHILERLASALDVPAEFLMILSRRLPEGFPLDGPMVSLLYEINQAPPSGRILERLRSEINSEISGLEILGRWSKKNRCLILHDHKPQTPREAQILSHIARIAEDELEMAAEWYAQELRTPIPIDRISQRYYGLTVVETDSADAEATLDEGRREIVISTRWGQTGVEDSPRHTNLGTSS